MSIKYHCIKCDTHFTKANLMLKPMCPLCGVDVEIARAKAEPVEVQEDPQWWNPYPYFEEEED